MMAKPFLDPPVLGFIPTMQPTLVEAAPEGDAWLHEIKYDGYRTQLIIERDGVRAFTRNGHDWTAKYPAIAAMASGLACTMAIIDGEIIVQDAEGRPDFHALRRAIAGNPSRLTFYAFDLLHLDGADMRRSKLVDRRRLLRGLIGRHDPTWPLQFSEHILGNGPAVFAAAEGLGLEGIVSKQAESTYRSGRTTAWLKTKAFAEEEFVIIGTERGVGPTIALLARETDTGLEYVGGAMLTLTDQEREHFWWAAATLRSEHAHAKTGKQKAEWLEPVIRARVRFLRSAGKVRHATVRGLIHPSGNKM